jgi:toxin YoeB
MTKRINTLVMDTLRSPFSGVGKPEPLKGSFTGWWSRRIDNEHRLVYRVSGSGDQQVLLVSSCRNHYE